MNTWYNETSLLLIENYIYHMRKPRTCMKKDQFLHCSYSIWAANELLNYVKDHSYNPPLDNVNAFIKIMDGYSCEGSENSYVFSIASDVAKDIFDMLLSHI